MNALFLEPVQARLQLGLSLPFSSSSDSMVRVGSETITTDAFYDRFFELVRRYLVVEVVPVKVP